jgi:membrane associated rhomboid family serine protease
MATCYRHPNRETGVSCSNCGNPICPDCMTPTPVGMRCPNCARQKTEVHTMRSMAVEPIATYILIALNIAVYIGVRSNPDIFDQLYVVGTTAYSSNPFSAPELHGVSQGEWYRIITGDFLHRDFLHILFNLLSLYWLGRMIEPALGHARYVGIYLASGLVGSLAVLIMGQGAYGASGCIYGLLGAAIVMARNRQINLMQSGLIPILAINLLLTISLGFSLAGHVGGLIGGLVTTWGVEELAKRRRNSTGAAVGICAAVGVAAIIGSIFAAG